MKKILLFLFLLVCLAYQATSQDFGAISQTLLHQSAFGNKSYTIQISQVVRKIFEDSKGNIWFTAENIGVYKYDGAKFTLYTTQDGLTTNGVQYIYEDNKGQLWFTTWQGICILDGDKFVNASEKEPWTN